MAVELTVDPAKGRPPAPAAEATRATGAAEGRVMFATLAPDRTPDAEAALQRAPERWRRRSGRHMAAEHEVMPCFCAAGNSVEGVLRKPSAQRGSPVFLQVQCMVDCLPDTGHDNVILCILPRTVAAGTLRTPTLRSLCLSPYILLITSSVSQAGALSTPQVLLLRFDVARNGIAAIG